MPKSIIFHYGKILNNHKCPALAGRRSTTHAKRVYRECSLHAHALVPCNCADDSANVQHVALSRRAGHRTFEYFANFMMKNDIFPFFF